MNPDDFSITQRALLIKTLDGAWAFVPPPLPPQLDLGALAQPLANASAAVGELKGAARRLRNPYMLIDPLMRREALTTSAMEGTITTLDDMVLEEAGVQPPPGDDAREAYNYNRALQGAVRQLPRLSLSHRVIREAHATLLRGLSVGRGAGKRPGQYKIHQNAIGRRGDNITDARYVPPPPAQTLDCMDKLEAYMNQELQAPAMRLIALALAHYQFEAIHPFDDGNGRIGRMLTTLMAIYTDLLDLPLLHVSAEIESSKDRYIDRLFAVSATADWVGWIAYFLGIVEASARDAVEITDRIIALEADLKQRAKATGRSPRLPMIIEALFVRPWTTASIVSNLCGVTFPTAQADLRALVNAGMLRERQGTSAKLYVAHEILALSNRH